MNSQNSKISLGGGGEEGRGRERLEFHLLYTLPYFLADVWDGYGFVF